MPGERYPARNNRVVPPNRLGEWVDGEELAAQGGGQVAGGLDITPTRSPGQFRPPFPPASFPVASPTRLPVSPRLPGSPWSPPSSGSPWSPARLPGSPWSTPRLPGSDFRPPRLHGLFRPPGLRSSPARPASDLYSDLPGLAESDHEGDEESDDEDSEGFELNGSDSDYIEADDGPGIGNGRTIRRSSSRPAGVGGQRAGVGIGDDGNAAHILLGGAAPPQHVAAPVQQDGALPNQQVNQPGP